MFSKAFVEAPSRLSYVVVAAVQWNFVHNTSRVGNELLHVLLTAYFAAYLQKFHENLFDLCQLRKQYNIAQRLHSFSYYEGKTGMWADPEGCAV